MIIISKKLPCNRRVSKRIFEKEQKINLENFIGKKYEKIDKENIYYNEKIKNIIINFDKEINNWLLDQLSYYHVYIIENDEKQDQLLTHSRELNLNDSNDMTILIGYLKKIFEKGLIKKKEKWEINNDIYINGNDLYILFKNKVGQSCKKIIDEVLNKNKVDKIDEYAKLLFENDDALLSIFNLDTLHDLERVPFLKKTYQKLFNRNFMDDYKEWLKNNRYFTEEIFEISKEINFEKKLLANIIKNNEILMKQNSLKEKEIIDLIKYNKGSFDVWIERNKLQNQYFLNIKNLYTSYFDSNPTNSNFDNDIEDIKKCSILSFNLGSIKITYRFDYDKNILDIKFSFSTNKFKNPIKMATDNKIDNSCLLTTNNSEKILENFEEIPEFKNYLEKIFEKGFYDFSSNTFTFNGKKTGPSVNMICAISLLLIYQDESLSKSLKNNDKFALNLIMMIFEEGFILKRIGDLGQILLANKFNYIFATNDHLQSIISILAGNKTLTTCGDIKLFYLNNYFRLTNLLNVDCEKYQSQSIFNPSSQQTELQESVQKLKRKRL